ncbi:phosphatidylinositol 3-kinase catalytic subunit type 3-like [Artemia franciscana]|uniref:Phosphatidylinositol 3-kinase catalytic subunit type 3 n=1 Tax=Artemia franciscana TaxID=6661 RepID=A0AA88LDB7_ARTSF|nr:hypothetical protein QYM36_006210 [Artemia franciscana]
MARTTPPAKLHYIYSCDLDLNVQIKIGSLQGKIESKKFHNVLDNPLSSYTDSEELCVVCQVWADNEPLALPVTTSYKPLNGRQNRRNWNEWIKLPVKYCDLPFTSQLCLTIYECSEPGNYSPVGGTTLPLFGKLSVFRQGLYDLRVWRNEPADGFAESKTPGRPKDTESFTMERLAGLTRKHREGMLPHSDWLDRVAFREMEELNEKEKKMMDFLYLAIELPRIELNNLEYSIMYYEKPGDDLIIKPLKLKEYVVLPDPDLNQENLVEKKHHCLARSARSGQSDKFLKPDAATRDFLTRIVESPPTRTLSSDEQDVVWRFRFHLMSHKKALAKFLLCVNWDSPSEVRQAVDLMKDWSPLEPEDALELFSPRYKHSVVRKYAVSRIAKASDEDIQLYLLQLVQALKYEGMNHSVEPETLSIPLTDGSQADNESSEPEDEPDLEASQTLSDIIDEEIEALDTVSAQGFESSVDLATFLVNRACGNIVLANYFNWYLASECEEADKSAKHDSKTRNVYLAVRDRFFKQLQTSGRRSKQLRKVLKRQQIVWERITGLLKTVHREAANRKKKIERLQTLLEDKDFQKACGSETEPLVFPLEPRVRISGLDASKGSLFKSNLMPAFLSFKTENNKTFPAIFKIGDDLRQDQLVVQIIALMDKLLKRENLDLKLTPYRVLAMPNKTGFVEFIDSVPVAEVLEKDGSILEFFKKFHPDEKAPFGVAPEVMDSYIRSCAGYCVITYLLGVGDRHLDNLMLTNSGRIFHIDFGYILGRDPKPLPPPMKLTKEMIEAMGGVQSEHYQKFRKLCYTTFLHLRRHSNLVLNLFSLMVDATIPDIALEPDKTVKKVQDKFRLEMTDEEAVVYMQNMIDISATAVMAALVDHLHKIAQAWRK